MERIPYRENLLGRATMAAIAWLVLVVVASAATATPGGTIPVGATTQVTLPASNVVTTCQPPAYFHPNPTTWSVFPDTVHVDGLPAPNIVPPPGHPLTVTVPASHNLFLGVQISWSGNTDCVSFNGLLVLNTCSPAADPVGCRLPPPPTSPVATPTPTALNACPTTFARAALPLARSYVPLTRSIRRNAGNPTRVAPLLNRARRLAVSTARRFDLAKLAKPGVWRRARPSFLSAPRATSAHAGPPCAKIGPRLRKGQLQALPGFASNIKKISDYDTAMLELTDAKYAADANFRSEVDHVTNLDSRYTGHKYSDLGPEDRVNIASQFQRQTGAIQILLRLAQNAGRSATGVVFGR